MTTNTYLFHDTLPPLVHSVIAVHPPNVPLVTNVHVKTDKKAAETLAQLHAVGMLKGVWIPPHEVRDLRALIAHREKLVQLSTMAKNRLHAMEHRKHLVLPDNPFSAIAHNLLYDVRISCQNPRFKQFVPILIMIEPGNCAKNSFERPEPGTENQV
jgi:hypothetical protein